DTVVVDEIKLGDNDNLSALVAVMASADLLLTMTDMDGLMDCDPRLNPNACLIEVVEDVTAEIRSLARGASSAVGRGGMASKIDAADKVRMSGIPMIIAKGKTPHLISRVLSGEMIGTLILPAKEKISARKHWIRYGLTPEGSVYVDGGAADAILSHGKSLLPIGVKKVEGNFEDGSAIRILSLTGETLAVGLINYSSDEIQKIMGRQTPEIDWVLGYRRDDEVVHADNLVLL
ncbi:MAG: glutamate 5-kinase, partial [Desulfomonilaceae bacterium]